MSGKSRFPPTRIPGGFRLRCLLGLGVTSSSFRVHVPRTVVRLGRDDRILAEAPQGLKGHGRSARSATGASEVDGQTAMV